MKNLQLIPILLPAEESRLHKRKDGSIWISEHIEVNGKYGETQHIYLTSNREIKEGDYFLNGDMICKCDLSHASEEWRTKEFTNGFSIKTKIFYSYEAEKCKKIEFTTDPKLIADGVPALPENGYIKHITPAGTHKRINFLEEFCKRYNENKKGVIGFEALENKEPIVKGFKTLDKGVDVDKLAKEDAEGRFEDDLTRRVSWKGGFIMGYNQALQSNTGKFDELLRWIDFQISLFPSEDYKGAMEDVKTKIQSLTKEQTKKYILIECEMEEDSYVSNNSREGTVKYLTIKLNKDGQPIIYFK